ncbi:type II secretion system protein [Sulfurospirillum sp.]|uniref:type II secretion system protein n=1 Tax=Sulfurospirillum sp. TaxID=2053622 RepID=UPI002FDEF511
MKKAFTMIELVMVIVILGIVASIGSEIVLTLYKNYIQSRAMNQLEIQTELTLEQIAKRLQYRIKPSTIARRENGNFTGLSNSDNSYSIIEWIGYSNESLLSSPPGWSGFIDLDHVNTNKTARTLKTTDSNLTFTGNTMSALTEGAVDLTAGREAALIFQTAYNAGDFGWAQNNINTNGTATIRVIRNTDDILTINYAIDIPTDIYEHYALAHSAYAIVPSNFNSTDFNLTLRFNYQPWLGQNYNSNGNEVLAEHVSLFQFKQDDTVIRLKLCLHDNNETGTGDRIAICKEKVIY